MNASFFPTQFQSYRDISMKTKLILMKLHWKGVNPETNNIIQILLDATTKYILCVNVEECLPGSSSSSAQSICPDTEFCSNRISINNCWYTLDVTMSRSFIIPHENTNDSFNLYACGFITRVTLLSFAFINSAHLVHHYHKVFKAFHS